MHERYLCFKTRKTPISLQRLVIALILWLCGTAHDSLSLSLFLRYLHIYIILHLNIPKSFVRPTQRIMTIWLTIYDNDILYIILSRGFDTFFSQLIYKISLSNPTNISFRISTNMSYGSQKDPCFFPPHIIVLLGSPQGSVFPPGSRSSNRRRGPRLRGLRGLRPRRPRRGSPRGARGARGGAGASGDCVLLLL